MRESKERSGSSLRNRETSFTAAGATTTKGGEKPSPCNSTTASPNFPFSVSKIACASTGSVFPLRLRAVILLPHDDLLECHDPVDQRLGTRGASGGGREPRPQTGRDRTARRPPASARCRSTPWRTGGTRGRTCAPN